MEALVAKEGNQRRARSSERAPSSEFRYNLHQPHASLRMSTYPAVPRLAVCVCVCVCSRSKGGAACSTFLCVTFRYTLRTASPTRMVPAVETCAYTPK